MSAQPSVVPKAPLSERMAVASLVCSLAHAEFPEVLDALGIPATERPKINLMIDADPLSAARELHDPQLRRMVIWDLLAVALSDGRYDAREREGLRLLALALEVPWSEVVEAEAKLAPGSRREDAWKRVAMWSAASVALALAAPALGTFFVALKSAAAVKAGLAALRAATLARAGILAGLTAKSGATALAAGSGSAATAFGTGSIAARGALGATGVAATLGPAFRTRRDLEGLDEHHLVRLGAHGMHVVIGVPGFLADATDLKESWAPLSRTRGEATMLRYDSSRLWTLGAAVQAARRDPRVVDAFTRFRGAGEAASPALAWPEQTLAAAKQHLADPARVAFERAQIAGRLLGKLLAERAHGFRPVSLVGVSFGAAVVTHALEHLAVENLPGIVHNVVLVGGVTPLVPGHVAFLEPVIAGRFVNAHSPKDLVLALLTTGQPTACGLAPVDGIENVDVSELAPDGQLDYTKSLDAILTRADLP